MKKQTQALSALESVMQSIVAGIKNGEVHSAKSFDAINIKYRSSGIPELDKIISKGKGFPRAKMIEVFGAENAGKTHLLFQYARVVQARGKIAVLFDVENRYSPEYIFDEIGLKKDLTIIIKCQSADEVLESMLTWCNDPRIGVIGIDSIGALVTEQEMEGELSDANIGAQARMLTRWSNRLTKKITNPDSPTVLCCNQLRDNVGGGTYAPQTKTPGGRSYKHLLCVRIKVTPRTKIERGGVVIGHEVEMKLEKNSVGPNHGIITVPLYYSHGFSSHEEIEDLMVKKKMKERSRFNFHLNEKGKDVKYSLSQKELFVWLKDYPLKMQKLWQLLHEESTAATAAVSTEQSINSEEGSTEPFSD